MNARMPYVIGTTTMDSVGPILRRRRNAVGSRVWCVPGCHIHSATLVIPVRRHHDARTPGASINYFNVKHSMDLVATATPEWEQARDR